MTAAGDPPDASARRVGMRPVWRLACPLMIAGLTQISVNLVDTVMLARWSTTALGAFALAAPVYLVALVVVRGLATAVQVEVARHHGAGRTARVARTVRTGTAMSALAGVAVGAVLYLAAAPVLRALGAAEDPAGAGADYLRVLAFAVPAAAVSFTLQAACAGIGATRVSMYTALLVNAVNLPLGLLLIFGAGLGVTGAAAATLAATVAGAAYTAVYARTRLPARTDGTDGTAGPRPTRTLWRIGWPEMCAMGIGYLNEALLAGFAARMGTGDLAAFRIVDNLTLVLFTVLTSAATAVTVLAGQALGAGDAERADAWRRAGLRLLAVLLLVPSAAVLAAGRPLVSLVTDDAAVAGLAWAALPAAALSMVPLLPAMAYGAALRAAGDTRSVMIASVAADYTALIPLAWLLGVHLGHGLPGLYVAWSAFGAVYSALLYRRHRRGLGSPARAPALPAEDGR
ncbi:MATE family efflux transporter [Actinomadura sp. WMMB 499]|uniref:MATE family efflux transporter n=1 Tax=Actinomadura sp. WMMB 499 TaxID=1219491 RepID=UPI0012450C62|nr:MATE family efflux transporter [Actinomadura sp. WMMB 499]QFG26238.1 MATE family efflux transporter [Actinomadura sp. WMMB 499]